MKENADKQNAGAEACPAAGPGLSSAQSVALYVQLDQAFDDAEMRWREVLPEGAWFRQMMEANQAFGSEAWVAFAKAGLAALRRRGAEVELALRCRVADLLCLVGRGDSVSLVKAAFACPQGRFVRGMPVSSVEADMVSGIISWIKGSKRFHWPVMLMTGAEALQTRLESIRQHQAQGVRRCMEEAVRKLHAHGERSLMAVRSKLFALMEGPSAPGAGIIFAQHNNVMLEMMDDVEGACEEPCGDADSESCSMEESEQRRGVRSLVDDLCSAAARGDVATVRSLIAVGVNVNALGTQGDSALHLAVVNNCLPVVELLLKCPQVDARLRNRYGYAPLHLAALQGHLECLKLLLGDASLGVSVNELDGNDCSPLHHAEDQAWSSCAEFLEKRGGASLSKWSRWQQE